MRTWIRSSLVLAVSWLWFAVPAAAQDVTVTAGAVTILRTASDCSLTTLNCVAGEMCADNLGGAGNARLFQCDPAADGGSGDFISVAISVPALVAGTTWGNTGAAFTWIFNSSATTDPGLRFETDRVISLGSQHVIQNLVAGTNAEIPFRDWADSVDDDMNHALLFVNLSDTTSGAEKAIMAFAIVRNGEIPPTTVLTLHPTLGTRFSVNVPTFDDVDLNWEDGVNTLTWTQPTLTANRSVTWPADPAGEITLLGQIITADNIRKVADCAVESCTAGGPRVCLSTMTGESTPTLFVCNEVVGIFSRVGSGKSTSHPVQDANQTAQGAVWVLDTSIGMRFADGVDGTAQDLAITQDSGDAEGTKRLLLDAGFAVPSVVEIPAGASPGYVAFVLTTDGTHACEGRIGIVTAAGVQCIATEAP